MGDAQAGAAKEAVLVRSTYGSEREAWEMAERLVAAGVVACAHVLAIRSCYRWDGAVQDDHEWLLEARAPAGSAAAVVEAIADGHPYDVPLVEVVPTTVTPAYARWMDEVTG